MSKPKIKLNKAAFRALRNSPEVRADLRRLAEAVARAAGEGFEADERPGRNRARASVVTATGEAVRSQAESNALQKALNAGR